MHNQSNNILHANKARLQKAATHLDSLPPCSFNREAKVDPVARVVNDKDKNPR